MSFVTQDCTSLCWSVQLTSLCPKVILREGIFDEVG